MPLKQCTRSRRH